MPLEGIIICIKPIVPSNRALRSHLMGTWRGSELVLIDVSVTLAVPDALYMVVDVFPAHAYLSV